MATQLLDGSQLLCMEDSDEEYLDDDDDEFEQLCHRASSRLSEVLRPRQLRFSGAPPLPTIAPVLEQDDEEEQPTAVKQQPAASQLQPQAQPVKVVVRVRPPLPGASGSGEPVAVPASATELMVHAPAAAAAKSRAAGQQQQQQELLFSFSKVLGGDTTQADVYAHTTDALVDDLLHLRSKSSVVFAFGSSGSGKTHSIEGSADDPGLLPRVLETVLQAPQVTSGHLGVSISCFELHNELVYDLLAPDGGSGSISNGLPGASQQQGGAAPARAPAAPGLPPLPAGRGAARAQKVLRHSLLQPAQQEGGRRALKVREDAQGQVVIPGLTVVPVRDVQQALGLQRKASRQRQQAATGVNASSSRSHCIFTVVLQERDTATGQAVGRTASLALCDLAGSERAGRTGNEGQRFRESCSINSSLMTLARCLGALRASQSRPAATAAAAPSAAPAASGAAPSAPAAPPAAPAALRVPWRESKLTQVFKEALHGQGKLVLLVAVSPSGADVDETMHVLRYAALATGITAVAAPPPPPPPRPAAPAPAPPTTTQRGKKPAPPAAAAEEAASALGRRVQALEAELAAARAELDRKAQALEDAEADVRSEVVSEVTALLNDLRAHYEDRLAQVANELRAKDALVEELQRRLEQQQQQQQQPEGVAAPAQPPQQEQGEPAAGAQGAVVVDGAQEAGGGSALQPDGADGRGSLEAEGGQEVAAAGAKAAEAERGVPAVQVRVIQEELAQGSGAAATAAAPADDEGPPAQSKGGRSARPARARKRTAAAAAEPSPQRDGGEHAAVALAADADVGAGQQVTGSPAPRRNLRRKRG